MALPVHRLYTMTTCIFHLPIAESSKDVGSSESLTATAKEVPWDELRSLLELNPPSVMPQGNVGTPLCVFMELIRTCKLPAYVIKKLNLEFPKSRSKKRYGAVGMDYGTSVQEGSEGSDDESSGRQKLKPPTQDTTDTEQDTEDSIPSVSQV